jgi:hypothetical protein
MQDELAVAGVETFMDIVGNDLEFIPFHDLLKSYCLTKYYNKLITSEINRKYRVDKSNPFTVAYYTCKCRTRNPGSAIER